jgi:uncharacterized protein YjbI with pentapeptide repeats
LPFLNVDLPLLGFFWLGPLIFLIVHAYVLLHFVLLAGKVGDFDAELKEQIPDEDVRRRLRRQLPSNIFVQFLAGSREVRTGVMGFMLRLIAQISLVIGPIALLVFFELQFLPYHDWAITWWHRIAVLADIALLWMLWPSIARGETAQLSRRDLRRGKIVALAVASLVPALLVTTIATFPGEWPLDNLPSLQFIPWKNQKNHPWWPPEWRLASLHELLVAGEVDFAARKPTSIWSNRLVLPGFDAIDHAKFDSEAKIDAVSETISLRARHLEGAVLIGAKLRKADFTGAQLQGAKFEKSDLRGAKFECGDNKEHSPQCAQLQGASLDSAQLQGASLDEAQLQGASLDKAQLQGASLDKAQLQGASLDEAQLQGASLDEAQLQGASFDKAQLQGASLDEAQLQGAVLYLTQLQGVSLIGTQLQGMSLDSIFAWRADAGEASWEDTRVVSPFIKPIKCFNATQLQLPDHRSGDLDYLPGRINSGYKKYKKKEPPNCDWTAEDFKKLKVLIAEVVPQGDHRRDAMERIEEKLDPDPTKTLAGEDEMAKLWNDRANSSPTTEVYEKRLAGIWEQIGCAAEGAPYVIRGLLAHFAYYRNPFEAQSSQPYKLAQAFLDEEQCPGAHGLTEDEKAKLRATRDRPPPPAAKP